ncbi:hypothetical protein EIN_186950 [Entamoeba invadens IP1]|uniref:hypothetical protein n=1 Tax=Entamoeba invadens IP1 TaxID=370355 RepID=UPI0002C3EA8C|nr:hypothetical protein EIN_186950 [Entamoeba invadens IP1]ELP94248.1 hypothetical protein EIN_186950 [Entamoeba invadens IP1]|eukprot:XP_004261019.1 hypothetical protein EIN_186950 [Entamoeba invadens IP1]
MHKHKKLCGRKGFVVTFDSTSAAAEFARDITKGQLPEKFQQSLNGIVARVFVKIRPSYERCLNVFFKSKILTNTYAPTPFPLILSFIVSCKLQHTNPKNVFSEIYDGKKEKKSVVKAKLTKLDKRKTQHNSSRQIVTGQDIVRSQSIDKNNDVSQHKSIEKKSSRSESAPWGYDLIDDISGRTDENRKRTEDSDQVENNTESINRAKKRRITMIKSKEESM